MKVITRFAPSPTGYLHIGGVRTALFNWLYAKANNGQIVVALIDKTEATLKKLKKNSSKIVLIPSNDLYQAQSYDLPRVQIQGILVGLMRKY